MSTCQKCGENTLISLDGHSKDLSYTSVPSMDFEHDGYFPYISGICGGDDISITLCFSCGQVQGSWPKVDAVKSAIEEHRDEDEDEDDDVDEYQREEKAEEEQKRTSKDDLMERMCYLKERMLNLDRVMNASDDQDLDTSFLLNEVQEWLNNERMYPVIDETKGSLGAIVFVDAEQRARFAQRWMPFG